MLFYMFKRSKKDEPENETNVLTDEEKIEEMKLRPDGRSVYSSRYFWGDRDERTKRSVRQFLLTSAAFIAIGGGVVWFGVGQYEYQRDMFYATTAPGTTVQFTNNETDVKIVETWTDKKHDVSVVRLDFSNASESVSRIGKNYNINIAYLKNAPLPRHFEAKFGFLGASNDAYLFLKGDLKNSPYKIILSSHRRINQQEDSQSDVSQFLEQNGRIDKALENNEDNDNNDSNNNAPSQKKAPLDAITFRINPYSDNTHQYNGSFLTKDGNLDYSKIIKVMSVKDNTKAINKQIQADRDYISKAEVTIEEYNDRLKIDPSDTDSKSSKEELESSIKDKEKEIKMLERQKNSFDSSHFTKENFGDMQTHFTSLEYENEN